MSQYDKQDVNTYDETAQPEKLPPCPLRTVYSELITIAAAMAKGDGFLSPYDTHPAAQGTATPYRCTRDATKGVGSADQASSKPNLRRSRFTPSRGRGGGGRFSKDRGWVFAID